jgi:tripartite-type tricarboxylate transporter receptor subunit TctC
VKLPRRQFLHLAAGAAALPAMAPVAWAQVYPSRPVGIVVGFSAGGQIDIIARLMGQWISDRLGQQFLIDNRSGAASNIAADAVVRAPADGHTLFLASATDAVNATLFDKLNFDLIRDTAAAASINRIPMVLEAHPSFPAKTVSEFDRLRQDQSGQDRHGVADDRNRSLYGRRPVQDDERPRSGARALSRRGQMLTDLVGGQVQFAFGGISVSIEHIRAGKLRALAVATAGRAASSLRRTRRSRSSTSSTINAALADPRIKARFGDLVVAVFPGSPADFGRHFAAETEKWAKVIRAANIKPE